MLSSLAAGPEGFVDDYWLPNEYTMMLMGYDESGQFFKKPRPNTHDALALDNNMDESINMPAFTPEHRELAKHFLKVTSRQNKFLRFPRNARDDESHINSKVLELECRLIATEILEKTDDYYMLAVRIWAESLSHILREEFVDKPDDWLLKMVFQHGESPDYTYSNKREEFLVKCFRDESGAVTKTMRAIQYFMNFLTNHQSYVLFGHISIATQVHPPYSITKNIVSPALLAIHVGDNDIQFVDVNMRTVNTNIRLTMRGDKWRKTKSIIKPANIKVIADRPALSKSCLPASLVLLAAKRVFDDMMLRAVSCFHKWNVATNSNFDAMKELISSVQHFQYDHESPPPAKLHISTIIV